MVFVGKILRFFTHNLVCGYLNVLNKKSPRGKITTAKGIKI